MNRQFSATLSQLHEMLSFIHSTFSTTGFDKELLFKVDLAVEEALVNIIKHGYPQSEGFIDISLFDCHESQFLEIIIKDRGVRFNPLNSLKKINIRSPLEQRSLGGYGVYIFINIMDEVLYTYENNYNILRLIKFY